MISVVALSNSIPSLNQHTESYLHTPPPIENRVLPLTNLFLPQSDAIKIHVIVIDTNVCHIHIHMHRKDVCTNM